MRVIVKTSGFYGGTWFDASPKHQKMPDKVARIFLPPYSDQLVDPHRKQADAPAAGGKLGEKG